MRGDVACSISQVVESRDSKHVRLGELSTGQSLLLVDPNNCLAGVDIAGHGGSQSSALSGQES